MGNYRILVLKYDLLRLPEVAEKVSALLRVQEEFRRWADGWAKSGGKEPPPERNPLKYFAERFIHGAKSLDWLKGLKKNGTEVRDARPPLIFDAQLRLNNEKDVSRGVFVDLLFRQIKIRKWSGQRGNVIVLPLSESAVKWILKRGAGGRKIDVGHGVGREEQEKPCSEVVRGPHVPTRSYTNRGQEAFGN